MKRSFHNELTSERPSTINTIYIRWLRKYTVKGREILQYNEEHRGRERTTTQRYLYVYVRIETGTDK